VASVHISCVAVSTTNSDTHSHSATSCPLNTRLSNIVCAPEYHQEPKYSVARSLVSKKNIDSTHQEPHILSTAARRMRRSENKDNN
jgi:hypothetical protein